LCVLVKVKMKMGMLWRLKNHTDDQVIQALRSSEHWKWHHSANSKLR
jgi:hypothetical protein